MMICRFLVFSVLISCLLAGCQPDHKQRVLDYGSKTDSGSTGHQSIVYQWAQMALEATARDTERFTPRPTVTSRYLGLFFVAVFDAWSRYDSAAVPVYLDKAKRRPHAEHTLRNKEKAVSYAAYRMLCHYYSADSLVFRDFLATFGFDPDDSSMDPATPEGIGNLAAATVLEARKHDGSNQYGDKYGSTGVRI